MHDLQRKNLTEIEGLNQRGGRTLSFVDLIAAGTMSAELVAHCWTAIAHGASFLTAARPGGAGKSTVLANLLALLPADEEIVTVTDPTVVCDRARRCHLAHEIGRGHWYGYIWGPEVARLMARMAAGERIASCLHADTLEELQDIVLGPPLMVPREHLNRLGLILFVHVTGGTRRRVAALYESTAQGHRLAFEWEPESDRIVRRGPSVLLPELGAGEEEFMARLEAVTRIVAAGQADLAAVRQQVLAAVA